MSRADFPDDCPAFEIKDTLYATLNGKVGVYAGSCCDGISCARVLLDIGHHEQRAISLTADQLVPLTSAARQVLNELP